MASPPLRLLLVDDDPTYRAHLRAVLEHRPTAYAFHVAGSLLQALGKARSEHFDAIVLDLSLPDVAREHEGLDELTRECPDTAVIVLTAETDPEVAVMAARHGAEDCRLKEDIDPEDLDVCIRAAVARRIHRWDRLQRLADASEHPHAQPKRQS